MVQLTKEQVPSLDNLFAGHTDTLVLSCLQGEMGEAWADQAEHPTCGRMIVGDFCFFGGDSAAPEAESLAKLPQDHASGFLLVLSPDEGWKRLLQQTYGEQCIELTRYGFERDASGLIQEKLQHNLQCLPSGFELQPIDRAIYQMTRQEEWSKDLCSQFADAEDFLRRGLGFVAMHEGKPVCGASSYTVYRGGIEIEIDTKEEYRRKGLATACASRLILECLDRGLYPSWDAANPISKALAQKLGYRFRGEYPTLLVNLDQAKGSV